MDPVEIFIAFIVAILAIAYPILLEVVSRLDEKYSSLHIIEIFNKEPKRKWFNILIYITLFAILMYILHLPPLIEVKGLDLIIENSAILFLFLCTIVLIILFFLFTNKVLVYYTPARFVKYLIKNDQTLKNENQTHFKALSDILYASIRQQNENLAKTISEYFYTAFKQKNKSEADGFEYPYVYYETTLKTIEELVNIKSQKFNFLKRDTIGGGWIIDDLRGLNISERTYSWMWLYLKLAIKYDQDDMIMNYWSNAHEIYRHNLRGFKWHDSDVTTTDSSSNKDFDNKLKRFKEFNNALGGLLLYKRKYECIGRIFKYTMDDPPKQELLPINIDQVIDTYIFFRDPYEQNFPWISTKYSFPEMEGLMSDGMIKKWICKYVAVLFLRQYTIIPYLIIDRPLELPTIPNNQGIKRNWLDNLKYFGTLVSEVYGDQDLKNSIGLSFLDDKWCDSNDKPRPSILVERIYELTARSYEDTQIEQTVSETKRDLFISSTMRILNEMFERYTSINNSSPIETDYTKWFINGTKAIIDKSSFADNQESENINFDSFLAQGVTEHFGRGISETFFYAKSHTYTVRPEDFFPAIEKLKNQQDDLVLICFGRNLSYFADQYKVKDLTETKFQDLEIITLSNYNYTLIGHSSFLIQKKDLPYFIYNDLDETIKKKYFLTALDEEKKTFASVVDLNLASSADLRDEFADSNRNKDLRKSVLLSIFFHAEIRWRKNINNIYLRIHTPYREQGLTNKISEIKEINWPSC